MYVKEPMKIESKSMNIIDNYLTDVYFKEDELPIVKRMIHTTGDVEYRKIIRFQNDFIKRAKKALTEGGLIYTDTNMGRMGINQSALKKTGCEILTLVDDKDIAQKAKKLGITRSIVAVEEAIARGVRIFVIGNAPTALFRLIELHKEGKIEPLFVVGVPVGFVGAAESKEALRDTDICAITTEGTKGGSNVAASVINALLYSVVER